MKAKLLSSLLLLWPLVSGSGLTLAAEEPSDDTVETEDAAAADADAGSEEEADPIVAEAASNSGAGTTTADDSFVPTVQISEDLSVSFPSDI